MTTANQRIPVLVTATEKAQITKMAKKIGLSTGEFMRRAAESFRPAEDEQALEAMIAQMVKSTEQAELAIDSAIEFVEASNQRIAAMELNRGGAS